MPHVQPAPDKSAALAALRQQIRAIEGTHVPTEGAGVSLGIAAIDSCLPGQSLQPGTHEFLCADACEAAATSGFLAHLLHRLSGTRGVAAWITQHRHVYAPGLVSCGLDPARILFIDVRHDRDALWAMEETMRSPALCAVVGDIGQADLTATRRLQLAAEESRVIGFLVRPSTASVAQTACLTRWRVGPAPSIDTDGLPGIGLESWHLSLLRARGGRAGAWQIYHDGTALKQWAPPAAAQALAEQRAWG